MQKHGNDEGEENIITTYFITLKTKSSIFSYVTVYTVVRTCYWDRQMIPKIRFMT